MVEYSVGNWDDELVESMVVVKVELMDDRVAAGSVYTLVVVMVAELVVVKVVWKVYNSVDRWDYEMVE